MTKTKTYTAGANAERTAIIAKVRREIGHPDNQAPVWIDGLALHNWLLRRDSRYNRRPGGIGKGNKS